ncbi:MAG: hypothetical protein ACLT8V_00110 [Streptococcus salivarius]
MAALKGPHVINGVHVYFNDNWQPAVRGYAQNAFGRDNRYYNEKGEQVFGTIIFKLRGSVYVRSDGAIVKGPQTIDGKSLKKKVVQVETIL